MAVKQLLTMNRSGEFDIRTYGTNHCGTANKFKIRYHLDCECSPRLDKRGFLFDQVGIQKYFENIKKTSLSCELLTKRSLKKLLEMILEENPGCQIYKMALTLSPEPFLASMTNSWENPDRPLADPIQPKKSSKPKTLIVSEPKDVHDYLRWRSQQSHTARR